MTEEILKDAEVNVTNIRSQFYKIETMVQEVEQDFKDGFADKAELNHWKDRLESLLHKMTSEQRSLVMDDFDEIPSMRDEILQTVKLQEAKDFADELKKRKVDVVDIKPANKGD